jgi:pyruvate/2-oxoglutarate dehydrogenase complex dihydrolipoamide dehydrogenase (E3) component
MSDKKIDLVVVGSGKMAQAYSKVLIDLGVQFTLVGRSHSRVESYNE